MELRQPSIEELTARYLGRPASDVSIIAVDSEIEPYDGVTPQLVDSRVAWEGALESFSYFVPAAEMPQCPMGWGQVVSLKQSCVALPMAVGHYPQAVRDVGALLTSPSITVPTPLVEDASVTEIVDRLSASSEPTSWFLALGILRLAGQLKSAARLVDDVSSRIPHEMSFAWDNEKAVLAWMTGHSALATSIWSSISQAVPAVFNLGVAELYGGSSQAAQGHFKMVIGRMPDTSGWHHLAQLYSAIAASR